MTPTKPTDMNNTPDINFSNMNSTSSTNESHPCHHTPTTHIPIDNTDTYNQHHTATSQRPHLHGLTTDINDNITDANLNSKPPNTNAIHHCHLTATDLTTNINSPTFPKHTTSNNQPPTTNHRHQHEQHDIH